MTGTSILLFAYEPRQHIVIEGAPDFATIGLAMRLGGWVNPRIKSGTATTSHTAAPRLSRLLVGRTTANAARATNIFPNNQIYASLTFRSNRALRYAKSVAPRSLHASSTTASPSPRHGSRQKLDKKRFLSKSKFSPRKLLKYHKTAKGKFGKICKSKRKTRQKA